MLETKLSLESVRVPQTNLRPTWPMHTHSLDLSQGVHVTSLESVRVPQTNPMRYTASLYDVGCSSAVD